MGKKCTGSGQPMAVVQDNCLFIFPTYSKSSLFTRSACQPSSGNHVVVLFCSQRSNHRFPGPMSNQKSLFVFVTMNCVRFFVKPKITRRNGKTGQPSEPRRQLWTQGDKKKSNFDFLKKKIENPAAIPWIVWILKEKTRFRILGRIQQKVNTANKHFFTLRSAFNWQNISQKKRYCIRSCSIILFSVHLRHGQQQQKRW